MPVGSSTSTASCGDIGVQASAIDPSAEIAEAFRPDPSDARNGRRACQRATMIGDSVVGGGERPGRAGDIAGAVGGAAIHSARRVTGLSRRAATACTWLIAACPASSRLLVGPPSGRETLAHRIPITALIASITSAATARRRRRRPGSMRSIRGVEQRVSGRPTSPAPRSPRRPAGGDRLVDVGDVHRERLRVASPVAGSSITVMVRLSAVAPNRGTRSGLRVPGATDSLTVSVSRGKQRCVGRRRTRDARRWRSPQCCRRPRTQRLGDALVVIQSSPAWVSWRPSPDPGHLDRRRSRRSRRPIVAHGIVPLPCTLVTEASIRPSCS